MQNIAALEAHLAPLNVFLEDTEVSEILINQPGELFVEKGGLFTRIEDEALTYHHLHRLVSLIANHNKKPFSSNQPRLSATLPEGYRIQAICPPIVEQGKISLSIRKYTTKQIRLNDYPDSFFASQSKEEAIQTLKNAILSRKTILISGGTSSGKTTFLNACLKEIPLHERLIILEDTREIRVNHQNHTCLISGFKQEQSNEADMIANMKASLRLRPDRILLGEMRGGEAATFLEAASTGHEGSFSTIHATTPELALERVCMLTERGGMRQQTRNELREYVKSVIDMVIQIKRLPDGRRQLIDIFECKK